MTRTDQALTSARLAARLEKLEARLRKTQAEMRETQARADALASNDPAEVAAWWVQKQGDQQPPDYQAEVPPWVGPGRPRPPGPAQGQDQQPQLSLEDQLAGMTPAQYAQARDDLGPGKANPNAYSRRNVHSKVAGDSQFGDMTPHQFAQFVRDMQAG